ncbi:hypothetical protein AB0B25_31025 [Nocardia sp. NPDC049190]|uniref:hypothetical protein n=1 Tax=Nocardia sp. NPDC049190 TaxID=3155650 RepID=UPI0033FEF5F5
MVAIPLLVAVAPVAAAVPVPAECVMFCNEQQHRPSGGCVMFCDQPVPPADENGCRWFCELGKRSDAGVR